MTNSTTLATEQLRRMRGMNRFYHERFFADIRFTTTAIVILFVVGAWEVPHAFLLIPPLGLLGAAQTAFDASYLVFSRQYSTALERRLNDAAGARVLVAHEMENLYLFPVDVTKVVTWNPRSLTWFGFMTIFYTVMGIGAFGFGLALGWSVLIAAGSLWTFAYLTTIGTLTVSSLIVGWWWFVTGVGERKLAAVVAGIGL